MATEASVLEALAEALPLGLQLGFYHISSPPTVSTALFSAAPGRPEEATFCENHFLAVSVSASQREFLVFAIEVLVFTTQNLTTIFISKADSTGYLHLLNAQPRTPSIIKTICTTFLSYLVKERLEGPRLLLSLFARSQNQYLFPGSIENPSKHVLDDRQLIKWWCRTLDPVLEEYGPAAKPPQQSENSSISSHAYIIVPGCDRFETRNFLPPGTKQELFSRWSNYYPQDLIAPEGSAPPRCLIPRFPDDPKARFLDDLDSELSDADRSSSGNWKTVASLDQFWEMMTFRQECSTGRLVGFIWIVFKHPPETEPKLISTMDSIHGVDEQPNRAVGQLPTPNQSQISDLDPVLPPLPSDNVPLGPIKAVSPHPSSPILQPTNASNQPPSNTQTELPRQKPQETQATESDPHNSKGLFYDPAKTFPVRWSTTSRGQLLLPEPKYQSLMQHLLSSDFSTQELAAQSTSSWIARAAELTQKTTTTPSSSSQTPPPPPPPPKKWGETITGRNTIPPKPTSTLNQSNGTADTDANNNNDDDDDDKPKVNILTGTRKKRKLDNGNGILNDATTAAKQEATLRLTTNTPDQIGNGMKRKA